MRGYGSIVLAALAAIVAALYAMVSGIEQDARIQRGRELFATMECSVCHRDGQQASRRFVPGDSVAISTSNFGAHYPPNLTPDEATGIGTWTKAEIVAAIRAGVRPDGSTVSPPWHARPTLSVEDAQAIASYLKSLRPVRRQPVHADVGDTSPAL